MLQPGADIDVGAAVALLAGTLALGFRHGFDWDHIAAIVDITSTTVANGRSGATWGKPALMPDDREPGPPGRLMLGPHRSRRPTPDLLDGPDAVSDHPRRDARMRAFGLGTVYALGHASVVAVLGVTAYLYGARLPEWVDPIMGRIVGVTLLLLGVWLLLSSYRYARHGHPFRLQSRWMLVGDGVRRAWERLKGSGGSATLATGPARAYGTATSYGIGMIHGVGAETASQVLLITALGGVAGQQLGLPLIASFIIGLVLGNTVIVGLSASGSRAVAGSRRRFLLIGLATGVASVAIGALFILGSDPVLPDPSAFLGALWGG